MEIVELLCQAGANPNVEDRWQNRPLDDALNAKKNSQAIMSLLVKSGARSVKNPKLHEEVQNSNYHKQSATNDTAPTTRRKKEEQEEPFSGTIAYWPPEMFKEAAQPSPTTDMWAAGMIMYVLLTGT